MFKIRTPGSGSGSGPSSTIIRQCSSVLCPQGSVVEPHHFITDPDSDFLFDADPDSTFHPDADPDPNPDTSFQIKAQTIENVLT